MPEIMISAAPEKSAPKAVTCRPKSKMIVLSNESSRPARVPPMKTPSVPRLNCCVLRALDVVPLSNVITGVPKRSGWAMLSSNVSVWMFVVADAKAPALVNVAAEAEDTAIVQRVAASASDLVGFIDISLGFLISIFETSGKSHGYHSCRVSIDFQFREIFL